MVPRWNWRSSPPRLGACGFAVLFALMFALPFVTRGASAEGINLSWNDCGLAGQPIETFACNSSTVHTLVASFQPPAGIDEFVGLAAELRVGSSTLPDWWKHGLDQCRGTDALQTRFNFTNGACTDLYERRGVGGLLYTVGYFGPNTARLQVTGAIPADHSTPVDPGREYYAFMIDVLPQISGPICEGCEQPVAITLSSIQLFQPLEVHHDPVITTPLARATAYWQAEAGAAPRLISIAPEHAPIGATVDLKGAEFRSIQAVRFGRTAAASFTVVSDSEITVAVPAGAYEGPIEVANPFGSSFSAQIFTPPVTISSFLPPQAPAGSEIHVFGHGFVGATQVAFGGAGASFQAQNDSMLAATVPADAVSGPIAITDVAGVGESATAFQVGPSPGGINLSWDDCGAAGSDTKTFVCQPNTGEKFTMVGSFTPPAALPGITGFQADIDIHAPQLPDWWKHGNNECRGLTGLVTSGDFRKDWKSCTDLGAGTGLMSVMVTEEIGYRGPNTAVFHVLGYGNPQPVDPYHEYYAFAVSVLANWVVDAACPGCNVPVTLTFDKMTLLQSNDPRYNPVIETPLQRNVIYWQGSPGPAPLITAISRTVGGPGTPVDISGQNFVDVRAVHFGGAVASFSVVSENALSTIAPPDTRSGPITVTTPHGLAISDSLFIAPPSIRGSDTNVGAPGQKIELFGRNFTRSTAVTFNGAPALFSVASDSLIGAVVPATATDGPIAVTNPAGSAISAFRFTVSTVQTAGAINLSWEDCGTNGSELAAPSCPGGVGPLATLVGSFVAPTGMTDFLGASADLTISSNADRLPDWWAHGAGNCRGVTGLATSFDFSGNSGKCLDFNAGQAIGGFEYDFGYQAPNRARLRLLYAVSEDKKGPLQPGSEYYSFKVLVMPAKGPAATCAGCQEPVAITLNSIQLFQPVDKNNDPILTGVAYRNHVRWQESQPADRFGPNLVANPSFERSLDGWDPSLGSRLERVEGGGNDGVFALRVVKADTSSEFGINDWPNTVLHTPPVPTTYRFGAWVRSPVAGATVLVRVREYDNRTRVQSADSPNIPVPLDWAWIEGQITTLHPGSALDLLVLAKAPASPAEVWLDGVTLQMSGTGPVIEVSPHVAAAVGIETDIPVVASDPSGALMQSLTADLSDLPTGNQATFDEDPGHGRGLLSWTPELEDGGGAYDVRFLALSQRETQALTQITVPPSGPTLVGNPGFENGLAGWNGVAGAQLQVVPAPRSGAQALAVSGGAASEFGVNDSPNWIPATPAAAGAHYRFACWVRADSGTGMARIMVREYSGKTRVGTTYSSNVALGVHWRKLLADVVTQAGGTTLDLQILCSPVQPGTRFLVDDVTIRAIDAAAVARARATLANLAPEGPANGLWPNPIHGRGTLAFSMVRRGAVDVALFDLAGRRVRTLAHDADLSPGRYQYDIDGRNDRGVALGPGVFFYRVMNPDGVRYGRFVIVE